MTEPTPEEMILFLQQEQMKATHIPNVNSDYIAMFHSTIRKLQDIEAQPVPVEPDTVCWFKHGPYKEVEPLVCVFDNPKDDDHYSPLIYREHYDALKLALQAAEKNHWDMAMAANIADEKRLDAEAALQSAQTENLTLRNVAVCATERAEKAEAELIKQGWKAPEQVKEWNPNYKQFIKNADDIRDLANRMKERK